jgi:hypothetical protein
VGVHLLFPEHAVSDIHIGRCDTGEDSFLDLRAGIVELEFEASSLYFFLSLFLRTFEKTDRFPVEKLYSLTGEM